MENESQKFEFNIDGLNLTFEVPFAGTLIAKVGQSKIIRSPYLGSTEKLKKIIQYASPSHLSFVQYNLEEDAWRKIIHEHENLSKIGPQQAHLCLPLHPLLFQKSQREETYHEKELGDLLPKLLNMEGWVKYASWLNERFTKASKKFAFDAIDEYTLEARLADFNHEITSDLLLKNVTAIREIDISLAKKHAKGIFDGTLDDEKSLIRLRRELHQRVESIYHILLDIVSNLKSIENSHPELLEIEDMCILFRHLLGNQLATMEHTSIRWGLQEMLLQLLDLSLGVQPVLNCSEDHGRSFFALALRLAILQLNHTHSKRELIKMIDTWDNGNAPLVKKFRKAVYGNLQAIHQLRDKNIVEHIDSKFIPNTEVLTYLPLDPKLVIQDPNSGYVIGLTDGGRELLNIA